MGGVIKKMLVPLLVLLVAGCGGEDTLSSSSGGSTGGTGGTGGSTNTAVRIGNGTGSNFTQGTLALGVSALSAGGSTSVTANLVDSAGNPYTTSTQVTFNSTCASQQTATLTSPVTTTTGFAASTYVAKGCEGNDTIIATATVGDSNITATATVSVQPATLGSIQFVSATPTNITLRGAGGVGLSEISTVVFRVLNNVGGIAPNVDVTFALDTEVGGLDISPDSAKTDANGLVQTVVQAGTIPTPVRVTATVGSISTQSDLLAVTTGIPTGRNISLSVETLNPAAWRVDGVQNAVTVRMADLFNNPVPDGTAATFTVEGGSIQGSCTTTGGACSVNWVSQNQRPVDGRATILVAVSGEESFIDINGNGIFDDGDQFPAEYDLPEAYRDDNENGQYDSGEFFIDYNRNGSYDVANGKYDGIRCARSDNLCGTPGKIILADQGVIVLADSFATITFLNADPVIVSGSGTEVEFTVGGFDHDQVMPAGTTISIESDNGQLIGPTSYTVGNTTRQRVYSITVRSDGTPSDGDLTVTVTAPDGEITSDSITISD